MTVYIFMSLKKVFKMGPHMSLWNLLCRGGESGDVVNMSCSAFIVKLEFLLGLKNTTVFFLSED